jgi:hypothetical protein
MGVLRAAIDRDVAVGGRVAGDDRRLGATGFASALSTACCAQSRTDSISDATSASIASANSIVLFGVFM